MSVIVTGIDIPKSCVRCDLCDSGGYCRALQRQTDKNVNERYKRCPLKSVDGLIEKLNHCVDRKLSIALGCNDLNERQKHMEAVNAYQRCISIIKEYCGMEDAE